MHLSHSERFQQDLVPTSKLIQELAVWDNVAVFQTLVISLRANPALKA